MAIYNSNSPFLLFAHEKKLSHQRRFCFFARQSYKLFPPHLRQLTPTYANLPHPASRRPSPSAPCPPVLPQFYLSSSSLEGTTKEQRRNNWKKSSGARAEIRGAGRRVCQGTPRRGEKIKKNMNLWSLHGNSCQMNFTRWGGSEGSRGGGFGNGHPKGVRRFKKTWIIMNCHEFMVITW